MGKKTSKNNDLLNSAKKVASHKVYDMVLDLVNDNREDLAEDVLKIDYLLEYTSTCIKQKDFKEAKDVIVKTRQRIDKVKKEGYNAEYIEYLYEGISKKIK
ncbi:MAG: hypothetical protein ACRC7N_12825 [Clostridium sp.]